MKKSIPASFTLVLATLSISLAVPTLAQSKGKDWKFEVSSGLEYDSRVSVVEIDRSKANSDIATEFDMGLTYKSKVADNTKLKLNYNFNADKMREESSFDTQIHRALGDLSQSFGAFDLGLQYMYIEAELDGREFLSFNRYAPYAEAYLGGKTMLARGSYLYTDKEFAGRSSRNSEVDAGTLDLFFFINGTTRYFITGYRYESNEAVADQFDYEGHRFKLRFIQKFNIASRRAKFKIGIDYEVRNYSSETPSIAAERDDDRSKLKLSLNIPLTDNVYSELKYEYHDFSSNLPAADYDQHIAGFKFGMTL